MSLKNAREAINDKWYESNYIDQSKYYSISQDLLKNYSDKMTEYHLDELKILSLKKMKKIIAKGEMDGLRLYKLSNELKNWRSGGRNLPIN